MVQIVVAPPGHAPEFIWFKGFSIEDGHHVPHAKLLPRSRLQELDIHPVGVLFVFEHAIRSALAFVILLERFASFLSLATPDEMPKADKATIKITERRKSLGFMIEVRLMREFFILQ